MDSTLRRPVRVAFTTLGCRLNQVDTEEMIAALPPDGGWAIVPWEDAADVYVLNSCTVTGKADQKCRQLARQAKRRRPGCRVVVAGCYAQIQPQALLALPEVDAVVGNTRKDQLEAWLRRLLAGEGRLLAVEEFPPARPFSGRQIRRFGGRARAYLKVQDGCDLRCSYCVIWRARGPGRSRPRDEVLAQAATLHAAGFAELVLAGVHLGSWGRDLGDRQGLAGLAAFLLERLPALRLRLGSLHPEELTPALLELLAAQPRLRRHLHVSLQSGSDPVLERMRRPYRAADARRAVLAAAAAAPDCGLGADVIVGFPGETESEFQQTCDLLEELPLTYLHVFRYSPRPGTDAAALPGSVAPEIVTGRAERLRRHAQERRRRFAVSLIAQRREATVEARSDRPGWRRATTDNYVTLQVPDRWSAGTLLLAEIAGRRGGTLYARRAWALPPEPPAAQEPPG